MKNAHITETTHFVGVRVPKDLHADLAKYSTASGRTMTDIVVAALTAYLKREEERAD